MQPRSIHEYATGSSTATTHSPLQLECPALNAAWERRAPSHGMRHTHLRATTQEGRPRGPARESPTYVFRGGSTRGTCLRRRPWYRETFEGVRRSVGQALAAIYSRRNYSRSWGFHVTGQLIIGNRSMLVVCRRGLGGLQWACNKTNTQCTVISHDER